MRGLMAVQRIAIAIHTSFVDLITKPGAVKK
jgi:hypothetical protein